MVPLLRSVLWTLGGAGLAAMLYWALLSTPESTVFMLAISALLTLASIAAIGVTTSGLLLGWAGGWRHHVHRRAVAGIGPFLAVLLFVAAVSWVVGRGLDLLAARDGEIAAWSIATFNRPDVAPLLNATRAVAEWIRWLAVPFLALVWLGDALEGRWRPIGNYAWLPRARTPARLALATTLAAITLWAPVRYGLYWMPSGLPATWVEPAVAIVKLGAIAVVGAVGLSLIARLAVRTAPDHT